MLASRASTVRPSLAFLLATLLVAPPALLRGNNLLVLMMVLVVGAAVLGLLLPRLSLRGISARRLLPRNGRVGEVLRIRYRVHRRGRHWVPAFSVNVQEKIEGVDVEVEQPAWLLHVAPGDTVHGDLHVRPAQRGRLILAGASLGTSFPFGLHRARVSVGPRREVVVHPRTVHVPASILRAARGSGLDGPRSGTHRGHGEEWFGTRPARPGDRLRDIAWRISAHKDSLIALERTRPQPPRLQVILDMSLATADLDEPDPLEARALEESAIECAASLLKAAHLAGDEVGLRVVGLSAAAHDPRRGSLHLDRMMTTMAMLDLDAPRSGPLAHPGERTGVIVVQPGRVRPLPGLQDVLYLSARTWRSRVGATP